jgi:hypothetical protein
MKVNPKVYYTTFGPNSADVSSTNFVKAVHRIVTNIVNPLSYWKLQSYDSINFSEIVLKCDVDPNKNMWVKIKKHATRDFCVGLLSIDSGSNWSPESNMIGAHPTANFRSVFLIAPNSKIYLVEVEDAIFFYTSNMSVQSPTSTINNSVSNNLAYSISAGILFQPQDYSNYCEGHAIFGGFPFAKSSSSASYSTSTGQSYISNFSPANLGADEHNANRRPSFAFYNNQWIKIKSTFASGEIANQKFGDSNSTESLVGLRLYEVKPFEATVNGPFIGNTKYARISNDTSINNNLILKYPTTSPEVGWKKCKTMIAYNSNLCLIWCKNTSDEFYVS